MTEHPNPTPQGAEPDDTRGIGVDQWVAQSDERREQHSGLRGRIEHFWRILPPAGKLALLTPAIMVPFLPISKGNLYNYGLFILIYALLALGLNVVVGFAGLLDLGYVAFFGFGAYIYAFLSGTHSAAGTPTPITGVPRRRSPSRSPSARCSASSSVPRRAGSSATTWRS